jgi:hypothetical protein
MPRQFANAQVSAYLAARQHLLPPTRLDEPVQVTRDLIALLIMGYQNRDHFLAPAPRSKVFDRAGNAMPTVWVDGRVVGVWRQRRDASVVTGLFEPISSAGQVALTAEARRLEAFLPGEVLMPRSMTPFMRDLV